MANLQIVISALNKASGEINKVKSEIKGVDGYRSSLLQIQPVRNQLKTL